MMIGFIFWVLSDGVSRFVFVWSIVVVIFVGLVLFMIYFGVKNKTKIERRLIREKIKEQQEALERTKKAE
jgi:low affinity Fe/Cu permease